MGRWRRLAPLARSLRLIHAAKAARGAEQTLASAISKPTLRCLIGYIGGKVMATQTSLLTFDQFMDLPDQEGVRRELDEGIVIEMSHASFSHGTIQGRVYAFLMAHLEQSGADFSLSQNTDFRLAPDIVRAPDVCVVRNLSLEAMEVIRGALVGHPDLAVEVVSESETAAALNRKVEQYLRAGTAAVWEMYPETRVVMVYRRSGETRKRTSGQILEETELLPGLSIAVEKIFAAIKK